MAASPTPIPDSRARVRIRESGVGGALPRPALAGRGLRLCPRSPNSVVRAVPPHPKFERRSNFDLSPQAGRGKRTHVSIFTYSKSPGLLSMPTLGGEIHGAKP